jgi:hypothetical protein
MNKFKNDYLYENDGNDYIEYPKAFEEGNRSGDYNKNPYAIGSGSYHDFNRGVKANNKRVKQ